MYSSSRSATHHIFFPPRLEVVVEQQNPDGLPTHLRYQFPLHRLLGHQSNRPTRLPLWRIAAHHGDDSLFLVRVQDFGRTGPLFFIESAIQAGLLIAMAESPN